MSVANIECKVIDLDDNKVVLERIAVWEDMYDKIFDRTTMAYLQLLNSMRVDYETLGNEYCEKCKDVCAEIEKFCAKTNLTDGSVAEIMLAAYDTRARLGDFRAYCIALEWNRPIEKQFFLPRKRILEKHGLIQAFQDLSDDKLDFLCLNLPPRIGKNLSNDTPILTKKGWKKHGELEVGDYVLNDKGYFVKVLATSEQMPITHRVTFSNGEQIDCHENHEWLLYDRHSLKEKVIETKEMIGKLRDGNTTHSHYRYLLPNKEPVFGEYKELPVEPYSLGAWLGDGTNRKNCITIGKNDNVIAETINKYYSIRQLYIHNTYGTYNYYFNGLRGDLQKVGMCYSRKTCIKHIPDMYLTASIEQRLQLLAGFLDTDGTLSKQEHRYHYSTTEEQLKNDFVSLVSTFGWRCCVTEYEAQTSSSGIVGKKKVYNIGFNPTMEIPCRLKRKQLKEFSKQRRIAITNIEPIDTKVTGKCIQVEGGIYLAGKTLTPTHNSTMSLFFLTFRAGLYPELSILGNGHSTSLTQSFYNEIINILTSEEYRFSQIFPNLSIAKKSAEYSWIDLEKEKRFHTLMFRSVDGGTTGLAEASNLLYCDDLVKDVETANNPERLEKLFYTYTSTIQDRKVQRLCKDGVYRPCPELHVNTPWSINDVTNRLIALYGDNGNNPRVRIISVPCYDENGESNFEYDYGKGFNKDYYRQLQMAEDPVIFSAKYLMRCIERDGIVFSAENVSYYNELPDEKPDRIVAYADVSHGGDDYFSMPVAYLYGRDVYIEDVWFENKFGGDDYSRPKVCDIIKKHNVHKVGFEKNNGGDFYATLIERDLKSANYRCNITTHNAPTNKSKCDRILACQNEIKGIASEENTYRLFFKSKEARQHNKCYCAAMQQLFTWNQNHGMQRKQHDDFPDSLAGLITNVLGAKVGKAKSINASEYL